MQTAAKFAAVGAAAAIVVGAGTAAFATSGSGTTGGSGSSSSAHNGNSAAMKKLRHKRLLTHLVHGQIVTHGSDGYITHSGIRGTATAVTATSITVKADDGFTQTFTLSKDTRVRERPASGKGKATAGTLSDLKSGDKVAVLGKAPEKSSAKPAASVVIDGLKK
jgi:preprotein translocase subunit YajC